MPALRVTVLAEPGDGELAGLEGPQPWGEARTVAPGAASEGDLAADLVVALRRPPAALAGPATARTVTWLATDPVERASDPAPEAGRLVAPNGAGLWRRAPWPVNDRLWALDPPPPGAGPLVVGGTGERRTELAGRLAASGHAVREAERLSVPELRASALVLALCGGGGALPAEATAALATRRVLVLSGCATTFGLLPGTDCLAGESDAEALEYTLACLRHPGAFHRIRVMAALAAERHRASVTYGRLARDLRLLERSPGARR